MELLNGVAEIFGTEMVKDFKYKFHHGSKFSVYTYHGCTVNVFGRNQIAPYKSKEHPMIQYLNVHHALENLRKESDTKGKKKTSNCNFEWFFFENTLNFYRK